jgi:hypothetical protein
MSSQFKMDCISCHGTLAQVAQNPNPWLNEPRCDTCHNDGKHQQNSALYRFSSGHGGIYCEACHDSTHAIAQSTQPRDAIKFIVLQGHTGTLDSCLVCHTAVPTGAGPHGIQLPHQVDFTFGPDHFSAQAPGTQAVYAHTLRNMGTVSDTYAVTWSSSRGWATVTGEVDGGSLVLPGAVNLSPSQQAILTVTVSVPSGNANLGLVETTMVTAASTLSATQIARVTDVTLVPRAHLYLPLAMRQ